ncbi:MAG: HD domain-containing protein [Bacteroidota bacterium]|nr:HD domain-containing protein [Bacteroidota bacterium]
MGKNNILNDPVSGFIRISNDLILELIDHPYFQRLRRIKQLGLTDLVFPGATHTRFQHTLGAFQLMNESIEILKSKGVKITDKEDFAVKVAILLHDIGHGPFSHTFENTLIKDVLHEEISLVLMKELNKHFKGKLDLAIKIFQDKYERKFFHQLISSQLDVDRLDYLRRDSFYSGVSEGIVGSERIIRMMNVVEDNLVIEKKGIYSIENFLRARSFMYWQVYLHKTVIGAEKLLVKIFERAIELAKQGIELNLNSNIEFFITNEVKVSDFKNQQILNNFISLDDADILLSIKRWVSHDDKILSVLSRNFLERKLFKVEISINPFNKNRVNEIKEILMKDFEIEEKLTNYFVFTDFIQNLMYDFSGSNISVMIDNDNVVDISEASSGINLSAMSKINQRYYLCYPKNIKVK